MKKVLFGINSLHIGGIQTALINLLQALDYSKYDGNPLQDYWSKLFLYTAATPNE